MHCSRAVQQLQLYIDKRLTLEQVRSLEAHLSTCTACQEELFLLEEIERALRGIEPVAEPADLTTNIMRRVALSSHPSRALAEEPNYILFRPSLAELLAAVVLATVATLGIILGQPSWRAVLPIANGHDGLSLFFINAWNTLLSIGINRGTLMLGLWVIGTILGIWITLILAGREVRSEWFKAMLDRLPVW
jgi:predicted anti-sigma-YlaC factor YlaD